MPLLIHNLAQQRMGTAVGEETMYEVGTMYAIREEREEFDGGHVRMIGKEKVPRRRIGTKSITVVIALLICCTWGYRTPWRMGFCGHWLARVGRSRRLARVCY